MKAFLIVAVACLVGAAAVAAESPMFDVATVKASPQVPLGTSVSINLGTFRNGSLTLTNATLTECLQFAYALVSQDQISGPNWIKSRDVRFDIVAKAPADASLDDARQMLQSLLADRLKVVIRHEQRQFSFLALVAARGGPKLAAVADTENVAAQNLAVPGRITGSRMPVSVLASLLSRFEQQLVVDRTGLTGRYRFVLEWAPDDRTAAPGDLTNRPSLSSALQEQLGLRLESRREPLDVIAVQSAEKIPTDN